ncbi:hypothetical protein QN239_31525 [Mycolicibacterium sp. Y3]
MLRFLDPSRNRYAGLLFAAILMCAPLALVVAIWAGWSAHSKQPLPTSSYIGLNTTTNQIELFADQVVRLALTGSGEQDRKILASKLVDPRGIDFPPVPWNVTSTAPTIIKRVAEQPDSAEWEVRVVVGYSAPGTGAVQFQSFIVNVLSSEGAYKATAVPRIENMEAPTMQVGPGYTIAVDLNSALGTAVSSFANAYYVPGTSQNIGRYVTGSFSGKPLAGSPFSSVTVQMIWAKEAPPQQPAAGDTVEVLATVRGSASQSTWYTMQIPVRLAFTDQKQWAVAAILTTIDVGKIIHQ